MSFFHTLARHPRKLFLRRVLFQVHLWLGLALSLYVVLISLSGAMLVFHHALVRNTLPLRPEPYEFAQTVSPVVVMKAAKAKFPGAQVTSLNMPTPTLPVFQLELHDAKQQEIHAIGEARTGAVIVLRRTWVDLVYDFHLYLLLGPAHGMQWNGLGAGGLLLLTVTGLALWWKGLAAWTRGLGVSLRHNWRRINYDVHHALGFWTMLFVSWWALSGIYFAWDRPFSAAVNALSPLRGAQEPAPTVPPASSHATSLEEIVALAKRAAPSGTLSYLSNPSLVEGEDVYAYMNTHSLDDFSHADIVRLRSSDGAVLSVWHYGQNRSLGDWLLWAMQPLHFGTYWGFGFQLVWCALGISLAVLTITGVVMYWNRFLRPRWRSLQRAGRASVAQRKLRT